MYCTNCGKYLESNSIYCRHCGTKCESSITKDDSHQNYPPTVINPIMPGQQDSKREKPQLPEKAQANEVITHSGTLIRDAETVLAEFNGKFTVVVNHYNNLKEETVQSILKNIPIDRLNDAGQGLRLGIIRKAGITNVAELLKFSQHQLEAIQGVGEVTARQAKAAVVHLERAARENVRINLDPDLQTQTSTQLIKALFQLQYNKDNVQGLTLILSNNRNQVLALLKHAKTAVSKPRWFFSFQKTKFTALDSLSALSQFLNSSDAHKAAHAVAEYRKSLLIGDQAVWDHFSQNAVAYYTQIEAITGISTEIHKTKGDLPDDLVERVEALELNTSLLKSSLRGYQVFGAKYAIVQRNTLIGDEMGLGKTVEAIAAIAHLHVEGERHFFVVCPASVLINWCREIVKHSLLQPFKLHGYERDENLNKWIADGGIAVTTYETLKTINLPPQINIDMLVVDEAHYAKNLSAQRTQAIRRIIKRSGRVLFMTGTPLENRVEEMKSIIHHLQPEIAAKLEPMGLLVNAFEFRNQIAPVYLRRNREDVLNELPELIQVEEWLDFGPQEEIKYNEAVREGRFMYMRRVAWTGGSPKASPKLDRLLDICDDALENNRKVVVFSFFRDVISTISQTLGQRGMEPITGSVTPARRQQIIDEFTQAPAGTTLICQVQAGGVGLNIQAASVVILCEPQIKPALETQAISRAYRMGQVHKVVVHRLLTDDSVDERMMEMLSNKQQLFDSYARDSVVADSSLQAKDITEKSLINQILEKEQTRLGFAVTAAEPDPGEDTA
jgi:superfamily II DNA or RNA helicase